MVWFGDGVLCYLIIQGCKLIFLNASNFVRFYKNIYLPAFEQIISTNFFFCAFAPRAEILLRLQMLSNWSGNVCQGCNPNYPLIFLSE